MRLAIGQLFLITNLVFSTLLLGQITVPSGYYSGTWAGDTTYIVTGDVLVNHGETLNIGAGAIVKFQGNYMIRVEGSLFANGTETDSIIFEPYDANSTSNGQWGGIKFYHYSSQHTSKSELSYFRTSYGGNGNWPQGAVVVYSKGSDESGVDSTIIRHGLIHNSSERGVSIQSNRRDTNSGLAGTKPYVHLSNLHIHSHQQDGIRIDNNYETEIKIDSLNVHGNNNDGVEINYNYDNTMISIDSLRSVDNNQRGLYVYRLESGTKLKVENGDFHSNQQNQVEARYLGQSSNYFSLRNSKIEDDTANDGYHAVYVYDCCDNNDDLSQTLDFRLNNWGSTVTALMNSGTNPQDLDEIHDYYEGNNYPLVRYAGFIGANASNAGFSGEISMRNSSGVDFGSNVPIGSTQLNLHLFDPDLAGTGSASVTVTSSVDADDEVVSLTELANSNGHFSGTLNLSETTFRIIEDEEQFLLDVAVEMENVSQEYPYWTADEVESRARATVHEVYSQAAIERYNNPQSNNSRDDGSLDVSGAALITATYTDATGDWGLADTSTASAVYGGVSGAISGVLTAANSPYVITGDVFVSEEDSLTIEAGVTFQFFGMHEMQVKGYLHAVGAARDSIHFVPFNANEQWGGLHITDANDAKSITLSYFSIKNGGSGSWSDAALVIRERRNGDAIHVSHGDISGATSVGLWIGYNYHYENSDNDNSLQEWGSIQVSNLNIHHNENGWAMETYYSHFINYDIDSLHIHSNEYGFRMSALYYPTEFNFTNSTVENNERDEIRLDWNNYVDPNVQIHFNHNTIRDTVNGFNNYDLVYVYGSGMNYEDSGWPVDFRGNYWGAEVTDSLNAGSNPRNHNFFYDWHDNNDYPLVNYADFVGATVTTGNTAELSFLDAGGNLLDHIGVNGDTLHLRVMDADGGVAGGDTMQVLVTSITDSVGSMITLHEEGNSGVFFGSIALSHGTFRVFEGTQEEFTDQVQNRAEQIRFENPLWDEGQVLDRAKADIDKAHFDAALIRYEEEVENAPLMRTDGAINLTSNDVVTMTYVDPVNDWGSSESVGLSIGYQGMYGNQNGALTAENSPYVVTGDLWVNDYDSLHIHPGVELFMSARTRFYVRGKLHAVGTEQDSIVMRGLNDRSGYWIGINLEYDNSAYNQGINTSSTISYVHIDNAGNSIFGNGALEVRDRYGDVSINHVLVTGSARNALRVGNMRGQSNDSVNVHVHHFKAPGPQYTGMEFNYNNYMNLDVSDVQIHNSSYDAMRVEYNNSSIMHFKNLDIKNNEEEAMRIRSNQSGSQVKVELSNFVNNNQRYYYDGIVTIGDYDYNNGSVIFNNNNFMDSNPDHHNNSNFYYVRVDANGGSSDQIDMTSNYWGQLVTAEMDSLGTRANISKIYDNWDSSNRSEVNYANWLSSPMIRPVKVHVEDTYVAIGDTVMVAIDVIVPLDTSVISAELTLTGFQDHLNVVSVETGQGLAGAAGWSLATNATDTSLYIAAAGANPVSGRGTLLWLKLASPDTASGALAPVNVSSAVFDDGGFGYNVDNGSVTVIQPLVVDFTLSADSGAYPLEVLFTNTVTGENIAEYIWNFGDGMMSHDANPVHTFLKPGNYSVSLSCVDVYGSSTSEVKPNVVSVDTLFGDVDFNASVQAYDAGLILQNSVGFIELDALQEHSGNVSGDGELTALDASVILQYVVHLIDELPHDTSDGGHLLATGDFGIHDQMFAPGHIIEVPIHFNQASNVYSIEGVVEYDPAHISYQDVVWEQPFNNFMKELVIESSGVIKFALAGASAIAENGLVAKLQFASNDEVTMDETEISLMDLRVNELPVIKLASKATLSRSLSTDDRVGIPNEFALKQNYPNPFNPVTRILYDIPEASNVTITIYNLLGNQVKTLVSGYQEPGFKTILWNATNERGAPVSAGMYLYSIKAGDFHQTKKMLLLK